MYSYNFQPNFHVKSNLCSIYIHAQRRKHRIYLALLNLCAYQTYTRIKYPEYTHDICYETMPMKWKTLEFFLKIKLTVAFQVKLNFQHGMLWQKENLFTSVLNAMNQQFDLVNRFNDFLGFDAQCECAPYQKHDIKFIMAA